MFGFDMFAPFLRVFLIIDYLRSHCQTTQTSTEAATEAATVMANSFRTLRFSSVAVDSMACRLSESIFEMAEECCSLSLPACLREVCMDCIVCSL